MNCDLEPQVLYSNPCVLPPSTEKTNYAATLALFPLCYYAVGVCVLAYRLQQNIPSSSAKGINKEDKSRSELVPPCPL